MSVMRSEREGFSLVEVIVAMLLLSFGLLAMTASAGYITTQLRSSTFDTQRNMARQQVVEQLRSTVYSNITNNSTGQTVGRYTVRWNVTDVSNSRKDIAVITTGPAYRAGQGSRTTVTDTVTITVVSP